MSAASSPPEMVGYGKYLLLQIEQELEIMKYEIPYVEGSREELDAKAIKDIKEYLNDNKKWELLLECAKAVNEGTISVQQMNFTFGFTGIEGRPFLAFCRKHCLEKYKAWLSSDAGGEPVEYDEQGFWGPSKK